MKHVTGVLLALLWAGSATAAPVAVTNHSFEDLYLGNNNLPPEYGGVVPAGSFPVGDPPTGWTLYDPGSATTQGGYVGVLNPGVQADYPPGDPAYFPLGAPDGNNAVLLYFDGDQTGPAYGVEQALADTLTANMRYTVHVDVGNIASGTALVQPFQGFGYYDLRGFPGYRVELLAGGVVIGQDDNTLVTSGTLADSTSEGVFQTSVFQVDVPASHPQLGQPLGIRLVSRNMADVPGVRGIEVDFDNVRIDASPVAAIPLSPGAVAVLLGVMAGLGALVIRRS